LDNFCMNRIFSIFGHQIIREPEAVVEFKESV